MDTLNIQHCSRRQLFARRALFFGLTGLTAAAGGALMLDIVRANGLGLLEIAGLLLFTGLFTWISGAFWTAVIGFVIRFNARNARPVDMAAADSAVPLRSRTALVMPIYNEDVERVAAGIDAVWRSLARHAESDSFDFFILSDTRDAVIAQAEEKAWRRLLARHEAVGRMFYRRRAQNHGRKAGNVADFVRTWGAAYECMVVLDADSIMTGETLVRLARLMQANPRAGILQTLPVPTGRETLFARLLQFASRLNGPMLASGLAFWQQSESNYWGHNAIIRVRPFAEFCSLPRLPGAEPLGGEILSHDFVEAAFMRAAGFEVWLLPDLGGSWEDMPSNALDYAARDRRWTQGNLQHMRVMPMRGLHPLSRLHLFTGILSYVTAPVWFAVLVLSSVLVCQEAMHEPQYFQPGTYALFPQWPQFRPGEIAVLLTMTIVVLFLPKILGAILAASDRALRRGFGGITRMSVSLVLEQLFSMLLAPAMMVFHSSFVVQTLLGKRVGWNAQERGDRGLGFAESFARYKGHTALGIVWGAVMLLVAPKFIWWMLPVLVGLLLSIPLAMLTSRTDLGRRARDWGLFLTPEETQPPRELAAVRAFNAANDVHEEHPALKLHHVPARAPLRMEPLQWA